MLAAKTSISFTTLSLIVCLSYVFLYKPLLNPEIQNQMGNAAYMAYSVLSFGLLSNFVIIVIPAKFFIAKEYFFIFVNEFFDKGTSKKVDEMKKKFNRFDKVYSQCMIRKIN
mmetsp:Transcript_33309/g.24466  ORF Transcript_33309/g.24466 Transcript_33309/m.24466 type:complete len:112 (-) Transcript_33309:457-792(-)